MSWKQERMRVYKDYLDLAQNKKTPLQRRKYIMKSVADEFKDLDYEMKKDKSWASKHKKEVRNLILDLEDVLDGVMTKREFDRAVEQYVSQSNYYLDPKVMHYRHETSSDTSQSESISESESESESESVSESASEESASEESASESEESESEENNDDDEVYN